MRYATLSRAVAFKTPHLVGDTLSLSLDFGQGRIITLTHSDPLWPTVLAALDAHPRRMILSKDWLVQLSAGAADLELDVLN